MTEPQTTTQPAVTQPAATPISTEAAAQHTTSPTSAASPTVTTGTTVMNTEGTTGRTAVTAEPIPTPEAPPPAATETPVNPRLGSLPSIFPDFDPAVLESVLDSVHGDEERAADILLGMSDPDYVSTVQPQPVSRYVAEAYLDY